jgi:CHASE1-domain containing sensor protein
MSKFTRTLAVGAILAAIGLASMTAAQATDQQPTLRPPTERQVGEPWRHHQVASPEQAAADTAHRRQTAQEHSYNPRTTPAQVPAPAPTQPNRQPSWLLTSLGVLAVLVAGLAALVVRRARRRAPPPAASPTQ